jgi:hypothetical protein
LSELAAINYVIDPRGKTVIDDKASVLSALGRSPDLAESLALALGEPSPQRTHTPRCCRAADGMTAPTGAGLPATARTCSAIRPASAIGWKIRVPGPRDRAGARGGFTEVRPRAALALEAWTMLATAPNGRGEHGGLDVRYTISGRTA